jgi:hypothetical protein
MSQTEWIKESRKTFEKIIGQVRLEQVNKWPLTPWLLDSDDNIYNNDDDNNVFKSLCV